MEPNWPQGHSSRPVCSGIWHSQSWPSIRRQVTTRTQCSIFLLKPIAQRSTRDRHAVLLQWLVLRPLLKSGHLNLSLKLGDLLVQL